MNGPIPSQANDMGGTLVRSNAATGPNRTEEPGLQHAQPHVPGERGRGYLQSFASGMSLLPLSTATNGGAGSRRLAAFAAVRCKPPGTTLAGCIRTYPSSVADQPTRIFVTRALSRRESAIEIAVPYISRILLASILAS